MSWDDYGYGYGPNKDVNCYTNRDGYTDMYGNMGPGYGYPDFGLSFPPLQNPPQFYSYAYQSSPPVPLPSQQPARRQKKRQSRDETPTIQYAEPLKISVPKTSKLIRNYRQEFSNYLQELSEEHRETAKNLAEQLKNFKSGRLCLPDQKFVPLPVALLPTIESALLDADAKIKDESVEQTFNDLPGPLKTGLVVLPPWPEASSLKEINQHPYKDQVPVDIIESLKNDNNIGPFCFGRLVGEELKKIDAGKRVAVARRIMTALTTLTEDLGPPGTKRRRLDEEMPI